MTSVATTLPVTCRVTCYGKSGVKTFPVTCVETFSASLDVTSSVEVPGDEVTLALSLTPPVTFPLTSPLTYRASAVMTSLLTFHRPVVTSPLTLPLTFCDLDLADAAAAAVVTSPLTSHLTFSCRPVGVTCRG